MIALSQAGVQNVVAPLGTAMTSDHVQIIRRIAKTVVLLFDGDAAGVNAALRTLDLFLNTGLTVNVMVLPKGDDPDTYIRRQGVEDFMELESRASPLLDFAVAACLDQHRGDSIAERIRRVDEVLRIIQKTSNPVGKSRVYWFGVRPLGNFSTGADGTIPNLGVLFFSSCQGKN